jgi:hypothetical protein
MGRVADGWWLGRAWIEMEEEFTHMDAGILYFVGKRSILSRGDRWWFMDGCAEL